MPLDWNTKASKPSKPKDENESVVQYTLNHLTMIVGMNKITEQNWEEFYARCVVLEKLNGAYMRRSMKSGLKDRPITVEDVKRWIGMQTNASTMTRAQFLKAHVGGFMMRTIREAKNK